MCWNTPQTLNKAVDNSALTFISCLCRALRLSRGGSLEHPQVPSDHVHTQGMCIALHIHAAFCISRDISEIFKASCGHLILKLFLLSFLGSYICSNCHPLLKASVMFNNCHYVFQQMPREKFVHIGGAPSLGK